jgi:hypothetical protein
MKCDLIELWSGRLLETLVANPSKLHAGQGLLHGDFQRLYYGLGLQAHTISQYRRRYGIYNSANR